MKKVFLLLSAVFFLPQVYAQSVYHLHYNQLIDGVRVPTYALFFQHEDGSGFLRTRYEDPISKSQMLLEMSLSEEPISDSAFLVDTSKLYIRTLLPEVILGDPHAVKNTPIFLFELNKLSGEMEMKRLVIETPNGEKKTDEDADFKAAYIDAASLKRELFANYFQEGEDFLENYFSTNSRDISPAEQKITMHLLIVADTLERSIGTSCALDVKRVTETFFYIAAYIGCKTNTRIIAGKTYNKRNVVSELKLLKPGADDIVIFYYTGHGYRKPQDARRYPYLDLRSKPEDDYLVETLNMEDIYKQIRQKGARTNLVISDCCNSYVGAKNAEGSKPFKKKSITPELNSAFVRNLFLNRISVLATAADSTQKASSNATFGGFFSYFLRNTVETSCSKNAYALKNREAATAPTWYDILLETQRLTYQKALRTYCDKPYIPQNICNQTPCFRIEK